MKTAITIWLVGASLLVTPLYSQTREYGGLGEGWTTALGGEGIRFGWRMFTAPQLEEICPSMEVAEKLRVSVTPLVLVVGESFAVERLTIHAIDREGQAIGPVPIALLTDSAAAELLNLNSDTLSTGRIFPIKAGDFHIRVQTICTVESGKMPENAYIQVRSLNRAEIPPVLLSRSQKNGRIRIDYSPGATETSVPSGPTRTTIVCGPGETAETRAATRPCFVMLITSTSTVPDDARPRCTGDAFWEQ